MSTEQHSVTTLFDLDGVLTRRDTMATLVAGRLKAHPVRLLVALPLVALSRFSPATGRLKPWLNRRLVSLSLWGLSEDGYGALVTRTAADLAQDPDNVPARAVEAVRSAAGTGRVVVVTATERQLATAYLTAIGLPDLEVLASSIHRVGRRWRLVGHNVGAAKVAAVRLAGIETTTATFVTDSTSDLPLARMCGETVLVNGDPRSRRVFRADVELLQTVTW